MDNDPTVDCPLWRERRRCLGCAFWSRIGTTDYMCKVDALLIHANEIAQNIKLIHESGEGHRLLTQQALRSTLTGGPTEELERLTGVKASPALPRDH